MAFETVFLEEQKKCLLEEKARLESELNRFAKPTDTQGDFATQMEDLGEGEDESALEVEDYVDNLGVETALEKELKDVLDALKKFDTGTYGICEASGKEIARERLQAYPAARTAL
jgi:RNA polymerase-binding transcription factor DksA